MAAGGIVKDHHSDTLHCSAAFFVVFALNGGSEGCDEALNETCNSELRVKRIKGDKTANINPQIRWQVREMIKNASKMYFKFKYLF